MAVTNKIVSSTPAATQSYDTAAWLPVAGKLYIVSVYSVQGSGTIVNPVVTGNNITYTQEETCLVQTAKRLTVFRALASGSPTSTATNFDFTSGGVDQNAVIVIIDEIDDPITTGTNGSGAVLQSVTAQGADTDGVVSHTLAAFQDAVNSYAYMAAAQAAGSTWTQGTGFTISAQDTEAGPACSLMTEYKSGEDTSVDATANDTAGFCAGIALELRLDAAAPATHLGFIDQPIDTIVDASIPAITVELLDATEVRVEGTDEVTLALQAGTGVLAGDKINNAVLGVATFAGLSINTVGAGKQIRATATGLTLADSSTFATLDLAATYLEFVVHPANVVEGVAISPSITVEANKADTTRDAAYVGSITLAIGTNPGGGVIGGTLTQAAVAGLATFNNITISAPGTGYTLNATAAGLTQAGSNAFNVTLEAATHLFYFVAPANTQVAAVITPSVVVRCRNSENVVDTNYTANVVIAKAPGAPAGTLGGTLTRAAVAGVATFNDLTLDTAGTFTLRVTSGAITLADSAAFDITAAPAPSAGTGGYFQMGGFLRLRL